MNQWVVHPEPPDALPGKKGPHDGRRFIALGHLVPLRQQFA
jgi:hypothetical protein